MTPRLAKGLIGSAGRNRDVCVSGLLTEAITLALGLMLAIFPNELAAGPRRQASSPAESPTRCIALELYTRSRNQELSGTAEAIRKLVGEIRGVRLRIYDLDEQPQAAERLDKIAKAYRLPRVDLPLVYGLNRTASGVADSAAWTSRLHNLLRVEIFMRQGCSRCEAAKHYLPSFRTKYSGLQVDVFDVVTNATANQRFSQLSRDQGIGGVSFPGFWLCQKLIIGFDGDTTTGGRLDAVLERWTVACEVAGPAARPAGPSVKQSAIPGLLPFMSAVLLSGLPQGDPPASTESDKNEGQSLPIAGTDELPALDITTENGSSAELPINGPATGEVHDEHSVEVPLLGRLSVDKLGMPLFTFLIGLVDGFNPCAMWVLLFLLSVLVNLQDRWKILAVAGTFVVISGAAYFAFMAAWLNVLLLVGFLRWVQILLAMLAICVGSIHVKDFFAFKKGISLSIPESAKPGIYSRVRRIVMAESLLAAIVGASVLAVLVNIIELLCTAGLPALYSQILALQKYPDWMNYAYLFLYIVAYMLDDTLMVGIVVATLGKRKLQEGQGRWLKLISGLVILALGLVLLLKPEWLG